MTHTHKHTMIGFAIHDCIMYELRSVCMPRRPSACQASDGFCPSVQIDGFPRNTVASEQQRSIMYGSYWSNIWINIHQRCCDSNHMTTKRKRVFLLNAECDVVARAVVFIAVTLHRLSSVSVVLARGATLATTGWAQKCEAHASATIGCAQECEAHALCCDCCDVEALSTAHFRMRMKRTTINTGTWARTLHFNFSVVSERSDSGLI